MKKGVKPKNFSMLQSPEVKAKRSASQMGRKAWNKGKKMPPSFMEKIKLRVGEKSGNWKGGISKEPTYHGFMKQRRRSRKSANGGSHTQGEWEILKAQYNWTCLSCLESEPKIKLTEDHIIPVSRGGSDNIENIQPLCKSCNCKKYTKTIQYKTNGNI